MNFQMFKLVFERADEPETKLPTSAESLKKQEEVHKNIYFCFIAYAKVFDCVDHNKLWKILKKLGIPDQRNLYAGQGDHLYVLFGEINNACLVLWLIF